MGAPQGQRTALPATSRGLTNCDYCFAETDPQPECDCGGCCGNAAEEEPAAEVEEGAESVAMIIEVGEGTSFGAAVFPDLKPMKRKQLLQKLVPSSDAGASASSWAARRR